MMLFCKLLLIIPALFFVIQTTPRALAATPDAAIKVQAPKIVQVHLKTTYLDGVSIEKVIKDHILSLEDFMVQHQDWQLVRHTNSALYLIKKVDGLSPVSKTAGVFGLKDDNTLSLFNGNLQQDDMIQTFFQIDIDALEAKDIRRLQDGIHVTNKQHFHKNA